MGAATAAASSRFAPKKIQTIHPLRAAAARPAEIALDAVIQSSWRTSRPPPHELREVREAHQRVLDPDHPAQVPLVGGELYRLGLIAVVCARYLEVPLVVGIDLRQRDLLGVLELLPAVLVRTLRRAFGG